MPVQALIVEPALADVLLLVPILSALGFQITATESFHEAKQSLRSPPQILITEIRLGEFNGLHLVLRGKSSRADMAAIVTTDVEDPVLQAEAEAMGATFVRKPVSATELEAAICRTVLRSRESPFLPVRAPFERRTVNRRRTQAISLVSDRRASDRRAEARARIAQLTLH